MFRSQKTTVMQAARRVSNLKNRKAGGWWLHSHGWMDEPSSLGQTGSPRILQRKVPSLAFKVWFFFLTFIVICIQDTYNFALVKRHNGLSKDKDKIVSFLGLFPNSDFLKAMPSGPLTASCGSPAIHLPPPIHSKPSKWTKFFLESMQRIPWQESILWKEMLGFGGNYSISN